MLDFSVTVGTLPLPDTSKAIQLSERAIRLRAWVRTLPRGSAGSTLAAMARMIKTGNTGDWNWQEDKRRAGEVNYWQIIG